MSGIRAILLVMMSTVAGTAGTVYTSSDNNGRSAMVTFETLANGLLQVTLANTSVAGATSTADVLTAVFFSVNPNRVLDPLSAGITSAGNLMGCTSCGSNQTDLSSEWAYRQGADFIANQSSVNVLTTYDFNNLSYVDKIGTGNLAGSFGVGGSDFGIVGANTVLNAQNILTGTPLVIGSVTFLLDPGQNFDHSAIGTVGFLWGSSAYTHMGSHESPESSTLALIGVGLLGLGVFGRRRQSTAA